MCVMSVWLESQLLKLMGIFYYNSNRWIESERVKRRESVRVHSKQQKYKLVQNLVDFLQLILYNVRISVGDRLSCSPSDSLCDLVEKMTRIEDTEVISPGLVSRLERVLGVNTGERVRIVIPRSQIQTGIGESPEYLVCLFTLSLFSDLYHITDPRSLNAK